MKGWRAEICAPDAQVVSMNGVEVRTQQPLEWAAELGQVVLRSSRKLPTIKVFLPSVL